MRLPPSPPVPGPPLLWTAEPAAPAEPENDDEKAPEADSDDGT